MNCKCLVLMLGIVGAGNLASASNAVAAARQCEELKRTPNAYTDWKLASQATYVLTSKLAVIITTCARGSGTDPEPYEVQQVAQVYEQGVGVISQRLRHGAQRSLGHHEVKAGKITFSFECMVQGAPSACSETWTFDQRDGIFARVGSDESDSVKTNLGKYRSALDAGEYLKASEVLETTIYQVPLEPNSL